MVKKSPVFTTGMLPVTQGLKPSIAASIGRTLTRHSYLEAMMLNCLSMLLEISIKQARIAVKIPRPHMFSNIVEDLLAFHRIKLDYNFRQLFKKLDAADKARNTLAHSVLIKDGDKIRIQIVAGSWDFPQDVEQVKRALIPETPILNAQFLRKQRKAVEDGIKATREFHAGIRAIMHTLHERRRKENALNRRRQDRT